MEDGSSWSRERDKHLLVRIGVMHFSFEGEALAMLVRGQWVHICPSGIVFMFLTLRIRPSAGGRFVCEVR